MERLAETDHFLASAMQKENKSIDECVAYVIFKVNGTKATTTIVDGDEVIRLATEYFKNDTITMPSMDKLKAEAKKEEVKPKKEEKKPKAKKVEMKTSWSGDLFDEL